MPLEKVHVKYPTKIQKWLRTDWFSDLFEHSPVCFKSMNPSFVAEGSHLDALTLPLVDILNFKMLKALKGCKDLIRSYTIDDWILTYSHIPISYSYHFFLFLSTPSIRQPARRCLRRALAGSSSGRLAALAQGEAVGPVSPATIRHDARRAIRRVRISKGGLKGFQCRNKASYRKCTGRFW